MISLLELFAHPNFSDHPIFNIGLCKDNAAFAATYISIILYKYSYMTIKQILFVLCALGINKNLSF